MLASGRNGTLYIGVTSDVIRRVWEHCHGEVDGFTKRYGATRLVYAEFHDDMTAAILREKQMKKWRRSWKIELIESENPRWEDLYDRFAGG
jgi:putative endonuclease